MLLSKTLFPVVIHVNLIKSIGNLFLQILYQVTRLSKLSIVICGDHQQFYPLIGKYTMFYLCISFQKMCALNDSVKTQGFRCFSNTTSIALTSVSNKNIIFLYQWRRWVSEYNFFFEISGHWIINFPTLFLKKSCCIPKTTSPCCWEWKNYNASSLFTIHLLGFCMSSSCLSH